MITTKTTFIVGRTKKDVDPPEGLETRSFVIDGEPVGVLKKLVRAQAMTIAQQLLDEDQVPRELFNLVEVMKHLEKRLAEEILKS